MSVPPKVSQEDEGGEGEGEPDNDDDPVGGTCEVDNVGATEGQL